MAGKINKLPQEDTLPGPLFTKDLKLKNIRSTGQFTHAGGLLPPSRRTGDLLLNLLKDSNMLILHEIIGNRWYRELTPVLIREDILNLPKDIHPPR